MTQNNEAIDKELLEAKFKLIEEYEKETVKEIRTVRQQTLKKFLLYFCLDRAPNNYVKSRRAEYDYKLAKEIIMNFIKHVEEITDTQLKARLELEKLELEKDNLNH